jgi:hypothetical protein
MKYTTESFTGSYAGRDERDRTAVVYQDATRPGQFRVRLELLPEHSDAASHGWYGGMKPCSGPGRTEAEAVVIGLMWEHFGMLPDQTYDAMGWARP